MIGSFTAILSRNQLDNEVVEEKQVDRLCYINENKALQCHTISKISEVHSLMQSERLFRYLLEQYKLVVQ